MPEDIKISIGEEEEKERERVEHLKEKDKLRTERAKYEKVWGRDSFLSCIFRAMGKLIMDMFARSFVMTVFFSAATYHYITKVNSPSEVITLVMAGLTAVFALYWIEKARGAQLWEAIIHRIKNGGDNKF